jgi:uncharacterized RDD family membrane protein YckC
MRCPKCHYISFGSVDRCRNCGYEFSLAPEAKPVDLPIHDSDAPVGPLSDLRLSDRPPASTIAEAASGHASARLDLPLFTDRGPADDAPLISVPSAPRPPLSVRRAQPAASRPRIERPQPDIDPHLDDAQESTTGDAPVADRGGLLAATPIPEPVRRSVPPRVAPVRAEASIEGHGALVVAPVWARLVAGIIDLAILLAIDAAVLYSTLRVLELQMSISDVRVLPPVPLAVFLLLLNGGYLATFTAAGGQTIGKMLTGIRVVAERPEDDQGFDRFTLRVTLGAAVLRAAAYLVSLLPAGLGFATILFDAEGRALHDRLSETRVVKA